MIRTADWPKWACDMLRVWHGRAWTFEYYVDLKMENGESFFFFFFFFLREKIKFVLLFTLFFCSVVPLIHYVSPW